MRAVTAAVAVSVTVPAAGVELGVDVDVVEADRVAQRDQLARALGRLDARDARHAEDVALGRVAGRHALGGRRGHAHDRAGHGAPGADLLGADVDHPRGALGVEVGELAHQAGATALRAPSMSSRTACRSPARSSAIGSGSPLTIPSKNSLRSW